MKKQDRRLRVLVDVLGEARDDYDALDAEAAYLAERLGTAWEERDKAQAELEEARKDASGWQYNYLTQRDLAEKLRVERDQARDAAHDGTRVCEADRERLRADLEESLTDAARLNHSLDATAAELARVEEQVAVFIADNVRLETERDQALTAADHWHDAWTVVKERCDGLEDALEEATQPDRLAQTTAKLADYAGASLTDAADTVARFWPVEVTDGMVEAAASKLAGKRGVYDEDRALAHVVLQAAMGAAQ